MSDAPATPSPDASPVATNGTSADTTSSLDPSTLDPSPAAAPSPPRPLAFEFHAEGGEYFRIWIVNLLLTIVTVGIYSAWAKVRRLRYFYGNTRIDGFGFEYHGRPIQILKGRLIAFGGYAIFYVSAQIAPWIGLAFLPLFAFGVPWIVMRARRFQLHVTAYRGLRFGFDGTYRQALRAYVGWPILATLSLGLLWPRSVWEKVDYLLSHARYGNETASFTTPRSVFHRFCYATVGVGIATYLGLITGGALMAEIIGSLFAPADGSGLETLFGMLEKSFGDASVEDTARLGFALFCLLVAGLWTTAYYRKSYLNASFGGLALGPHRVESNLETGPLFALYASNFFLVVLTLGLYMPWAKVRETRLQLSSLRILVEGELDRFVAAAGEGVDAVGEELGDFFDVDFGL